MKIRITIDEFDIHRDDGSYRLSVESICELSREECSTPLGTEKLLVLQSVDPIYIEARHWSESSEKWHLMHVPTKKLFELYPELLREIERKALYV